MAKPDLMRGTVATSKAGSVDVMKVAKHYSNVCNVPENFRSFAKASELSFAFHSLLRYIKHLETHTDDTLHWKVEK